MRMILVSPGSQYSTTEVFDGLSDGLRQLGHEVIEYDVLRQIYFARRELVNLLVEAGKEDHIPPPNIKPGEGNALPADVRARYNAFLDDVRFSGVRDILVWARRYAVDAVVIVSGYMISNEVLSMLSRRADTPHGAGVAKTMLVFTESPYEDERQLGAARLVDACSTNDEASLPALIDANPWSIYCPMAYHSGLHLPRGVEPKPAAHDVVFVGVGYPERIALLEGVDWQGINLGLYGDWQFVGADSPLRPFIHQGIVPNAEAVELYRGSKVGLNLFRQCVDYWPSGSGDQARTAGSGTSLNPRSYELAAIGVPQVSQWRPELDSVFGSLFVDRCSFVDSAGLELAVRQLLADCALRDLFATDQSERVIGVHSYANRAARIAALLEEV